MLKYYTEIWERAQSVIATKAAASVSALKT